MTLIHYNNAGHTTPGVQFAGVEQGCSRTPIQPRYTPDVSRLISSVKHNTVGEMSGNFLWLGYADVHLVSFP